MKKLSFRYKIGILALASIFVAIVSCQDEYDPDLVTYPEITVDGFSPSEGYPGSIVTITGSNFGDRFEAAKISFNGELVTEFVSYQDNIMEVRVPQGATNGKLSVQVWTHVKDSIGSYAVKQLPVMVSAQSENGSNIVFPGDVVTIVGSNFGTNATALGITFNGTAAEIVSVQDNEIKVTAPEGFATGYIDLTIGGSTVIGSTVIINPTAAGDITPYFLANTGDVEGGGLFNPDLDVLVPDNARYGNQGAPWVTNQATKNKTNGDGVKVGGWGREPWGGAQPGYICFETWGSTPITDGKVYQQTAYELPAGDYTLSFKYFSENKPISSVHMIVAEGDGIPSLAGLATSIAYAETWNETPIDTTSPNSGDVTEEINFTLETSKKVSIGLLVNMAGADARAGYFKVSWIKLVKN